MVATPAGIVYQSARGMYLLPRGFGPVQWLGERARDHLDTYPTVNGATVDQANGLAVFTTIGASAGALLIWDYLRNEWMTWTATPGDRKFSTVTYYDGALHFMTPDVTALYSYTPGVFVDDADPFIPTLVETNRIRTSGFVTGWARNSYVRIVGEYQGPCTLTVDVAYNDGAYTTTKSWNLDSPLAAGDTVERELVLPIQLSKSVQFRVSDAEYDANGGTGGLTLIAMSVGVAARQSHGAPFDAAKRG